MKIYKSTLSQFLNEARAPFYLCSNTMLIEGAKMPQCYFAVSLAGRNENGEMCELLLRTPAVYQFDANACTLAHQQSQAWLNELRTRLTALELEIRDGCVGEPMAGRIE